MAIDEMESLRHRYHERGYAIAEGVVPPGVLSDIASRIEAIQERAGHLPGRLAGHLVFERELPASRRSGIQPCDTGEAVFIIGSPPDFDPAFAALAISPRLVRLARALLGTGNIRYHFSNVTMKRPFVGSGIAWHRDFPNEYICPPDSDFVRAMVCLDGMTDQNGATEFVVGSHAISDAEARRRPARRHEPRDCDVERAVCGPGSVIFIHPKVIHGGRPNGSSRQRRNFVVQWGRSDARLLTPEVETLANATVEDIGNWLAAQGQAAADVSAVLSRGAGV